MRIFPELTVDQEFETLGASGATGALNDRQFTYLKSIGYTQASLPDAISEFRNFNPVSLFNSTTNARGFFYDFSDYSTMFTDTAGTIRITGTGQSLARVNDKSGLGNHATQGTAGSQPLTVIRPLSVERRNFAIGSGDVGGSLLWISPASSNGITVTRIASGIDADGLPYNDWTVTGTASATSTVPIIFGAPARVAATTGQQFTCSARIQVIAGTAPSAGNGFRPSIDGETAPTTFVEFGGGTPVAPTSETLASTTYTLANALSNQARGTAAIVTASGLTVNYTIRIKALQFELGSTRTTYQRVITANEWYQDGLQSYRGIQTDGVDDWMQTAAIDFSNSDEMTVIVGLRKLSDAARAMVVELGVPASSGFFNIEAPNAALNNFAAGARGTISVAAGFTQAAPSTQVITSTNKISADSLILRGNGTQRATSVLDQGTGNYANDIVYLFRRAGTSLPANVICTFMLVINRTLTSEELARLEAYVNSRTGAY